MVKKMSLAFPARESWAFEVIDIRDSKEGKLGTRELYSSFCLYKQDYSRRWPLYSTRNYPVGLHSL